MDTNHFEDPSQRSSQRSQAVRRFIGENKNAGAIQRTRRLIEEDILVVSGCPEFALRDEAIWSSDLDRSVARRFHAFLCVADWIGSYDELNGEDKKKLLDAASFLIDSWITYDHDEDFMVFHDETTAQRVINLCALLADCKGELSDHTRQKIKQVVDNDLDRLRSDSFYAGINNHGMFQDIALIVASELYVGSTQEKQELENLAFERLYQYFSTCFTEEGIHVENAPSYHLMISRYLRNVIDLASVCGESSRFSDLEEILYRAEVYSSFVLSPSRSFPPISDTEQLVIRPEAARLAYSKGYFEYAASGGVSGNPLEGVRYVAPKSGYAIHRTSFTDTDASFVLFSAAYNADYHKHSDELSLLIFNNGIELIREAGPYGYDRRDPFTTYGFSSAAHNTLLVDGQGLPRVDGNSNLTSLEDLSHSEDELRVKGKTLRYSGIEWTREVHVSSGGADQPIQIIDELVASADHEYTFLWHFGRGLEVVPRSNVLEVFHEKVGKVGELTWKASSAISSVKVVEGQTEPYIQGWEFPRMNERVSSPCLEVTVEGATASVAWEFRTRDFRLVDRGVGGAIISNQEWKSFSAEKPIQYLLEAPKDCDPTGLIVAFSAITEKWDFSYNYRTSLQASKCAKLYILDDFGDQGAYYLTNVGRFSEFRSVQGLIHKVISDLGLSPNHCCALGSSKGGTAALIHGLTSGFRDIFCGAPQFFVGDFLSGPHPNVLEYMSGGIDQRHIELVNQYVQRVLISSAKVSDVRLVVGSRDHHLAGHVRPLSAFLDRIGVANRILEVPGASHSEIGPVFANYVNSVARTWNTPDASEVPHATSWDSVTKQLGVAVDLLPGDRVAFTPFADGKPAGPTTSYSTTDSCRWTLPRAKTARVRVYVRREGNQFAFGTRTVKCR